MGVVVLIGIVGFVLGRRPPPVDVSETAAAQGQADVASGFMDAYGYVDSPIGDDYSGSAGLGDHTIGHAVSGVGPGSGMAVDPRGAGLGRRPPGRHQPRRITQSPSGGARLPGKSFGDFAASGHDRPSSGGSHGARGSLVEDL